MKHRILIVDDDDNFRTSLRATLFEEGFEVIEADTIHDGLRILEADELIKIIILDLHFENPQKEDGFDFLVAIKDKASTYKILVNTAYDPLFKELLQRLGTKDVEASTWLLKIPDKNDHLLRFAVEKASSEIVNEELVRQIGRHLAIHNTLNSDKGENVKLQEALSLICSSVLEEIGGYTCHIRLLDWKKGDYEFIAYAGPENIAQIFSENRNLNDPFSGEAARIGEPLKYDDLRSESKFLEHRRQILTSSPDDTAEEYFNTVISAYIVPIKTRLWDDVNQVDAVLNVSSAAENFFSDEKIKKIEEFKSHLEIAVSKYLLHVKRDEIHEDYSRSNKLLVEVSEKLQDSEISQVFDVVLQNVAGIIQAETVTIFLHNENTDRVESRAEISGTEIRYDTGESYGRGECLTGRVFESGEPLLINEDPARNEHYRTDENMDVDRLPSRQLKHYLGIPLKVGDQTIGVLRVNNKKSSYYDSHFPDVAHKEECLLVRGFSRDCRTILGIIANNLAVTIRNLELIERQKETISQLKTLADVAQQISSNFGLEGDDIFETIVKNTAKVMNAAVCMLFWKNEEKNKIVLKVCEGIDFIGNCSYKLGEGLTGTVAKDGQPILRNDSNEGLGKYDEAIRARLKKKYGEDTEINSFMIVPIVVWDDSPMRNNETYGVLKVINKRPNHSKFTDDDLKMFETFASQISIAFAMSERNQSLFKLVQGVGHEINNTVVLVGPNVSIQRSKVDEFLEANLANEAVKSFELIEQVKVQLAKIQEAVEEARDFTEDLLGFSESKFREKHLVDVNDAISKEVERIRQSPAPGVTNIERVRVSLDFQESRLVLSIFEIPFVHAIRNIVANAYQAMNSLPDGTLTISTGTRKVRGKEVASIKITDSGIGISKSNQSRVFQSGFSNREGGNGLGLWLVKISLLRMDGYIEVNSRIGVGTTFTITLPIPGADSR